MQQESQRACAAFGVTDQGRVRRGNEDAFVSQPDSGIFIVCDGMGGAAAGEVASRLAAEVASASLLEAAAASNFTEALVGASVAAANTAVFRRATEDRRTEGMGTTLVMLALAPIGLHAVLAHVGDSRCYLWRKAALTCLTVDHSLVEEQVRLGQITRRQAERSALQHVITRAIGTAPDVLPDLQLLEVLPNDLFMLSSDGLTKELSEDDIALILTRYAADPEHGEQTAAEALVDAANAAGGRDNITCILVRVL